MCFKPILNDIGYCANTKQRKVSAATLILDIKPTLRQEALLKEYLMMIQG